MAKSAKDERKLHIFADSLHSVMSIHGIIMKYVATAIVNDDEPQ